MGYRHFYLSRSLLEINRNHASFVQIDAEFCIFVVLDAKFYHLVEQNLYS